MTKLMKLFAISILILLAGCQSNSIRTIEYFEQEKEKMAIEIENILISLGFENFSVFIYCHIKSDGSILTQERYLTKYSGLGFNPEGPPDSDLDSSLYYDMSPMFGHVVQNVTKTNYDTHNKSEYIYMNISILIILDEITSKQKIELFKLLESYLLNDERNDTLYIVSRGDFSR